MKKWQVLEEVFAIKTKWVDFVYEKLLDEQDNHLDYYRVARADSVVILPFLDEKLVAPKAYYRHGVGKMTLDFPGGRIESGEDVGTKAKKILATELGVVLDEVIDVTLFGEGLLVDSSFSSQKLYGAVAQIKTSKKLDTVDTDKDSINRLLDKIECLQCRHILLEWTINKGIFDA